MNDARTPAASGERALRESKERFRALMDASPDAIFVEDEDGIVLDANPAAGRLHGLSRGDLVGRNVLDLVPADVREQVRAEFRGWFTGERTSYQGYSLASDGRRIAVEIRGSLLRYNGRRAVLLQVRDVTERRQAEEGMARLIACFLQFSDDPDRNVDRLVSLCGERLGASCALYNRLEGPMLRACGQWQTPPDFRSVDTAEGHICFDVIQRNDERPLVVRDLQHTAYAVSDPNVAAYHLATYVGCAVKWNRQPIGSLCVVFSTDVVPSERDLDFLSFVAAAIAVEEDRRRGRDVRRRLEEQIRQAQKIESLGMLAGGIAHDFNNLLLSVLGNADLALAELPPQSAARPCLENIRKAGTRAAELTGQMLAYAGKRPVEICHTDLNAVVAEMADLLRASVGKKALLRFNRHDPLPAIAADPSQIRQIALNLIVNASDALGENAGVIAVETGVVEADRTFFADAYFQESFDPGSYVYLRVSDTGCGMNASTLARIFDPFFTTKFVGRGLGLAVVSGIVRSHRGAVRVESRPGEGSVFTVYFPAAPAAEKAPESPAVAPPAEAGTGLVLVVDDEADVRAVVSAMLRRHGYQVQTAASGGEGLRLLRELHGRVSLVLLDMSMPDMNGEEVASAMQRQGETVPVLLSSGFSEADVDRRLAQVAFAGFIQKPYAMQALLDKVRDVLRRPPQP